MFQVNRPTKKSPPVIRMATTHELTAYRERKRIKADKENKADITIKTGNG